MLVSADFQLAAHATASALCAFRSPRAGGRSAGRLVVGFALDSVAFRSGKNFSANGLTSSARHAKLSYMKTTKVPKLPQATG